MALPLVSHAERRGASECKHDGPSSQVLQLRLRSFSKAVWIRKVLSSIHLAFHLATHQQTMAGDSPSRREHKHRDRDSERDRDHRHRRSTSACLVLLSLLLTG